MQIKDRVAMIAQMVFAAYGAWSLLALVLKASGGSCLPLAGVMCSMIK